jgi:tetrahydromethanopterin S-methyltransferase subunit B
MVKRIQQILVMSVIVLLITSALPVYAVDTLVPSDFEQDSWSKNIDFFDYVRVYAALHGKTPPKETDHAYLNLAYINTSGLQVLSAGLFNITDEQNAVTIPIQTTMMHYTSEDGLKDVATASSFVMLMAFNETGNTIFEQSPDRNDTLYASFSLGYDLDELFEDSKPDLNSKTEVIPLTSTENGLVWTWGMKYTDLAALWWKTSIDPDNPSRDARPIALTVYDELTFTYKLEINPETGEATLNMNYDIGKMRDLWLFTWLLVLPIPLGHYNSTGCYTLKGQQQLSTETIHDFLQNRGIMMSTVNFQATAILNHTAYFESQGTNVQDNEVIVDDTTIDTFADDGEKILEANFAAKETYNLFNYTLDPTETSYETYPVTTRTTKIAGFARNPIFAVHTSLMKLIPTVMASIDPELYAQAKDHLLDMNYADYFYITAYPEYGGYRIEHDPTVTAYCHLTTNEQLPQEPAPKEGLGVLLIAVGIILIVAFLVVVIRRRK